MSWKYFLKKRLSGTTIWVILVLIILSAFIFILLDESCFFYPGKLISIQPQSVPSPVNAPYESENDPEVTETDTLEPPPLILCGGQALFSPQKEYIPNSADFSGFPGLLRSARNDGIGMIANANFDHRERILAQAGNSAWRSRNQPKGVYVNVVSS